MFYFIKRNNIRIEFDPFHSFTCNEQFQFVRCQSRYVPCQEKYYKMPNPKNNTTSSMKNKNEKKQKSNNNNNNSVKIGQHHRQPIVRTLAPILVFPVSFQNSIFFGPPLARLCRSPPAAQPPFSSSSPSCRRRSNLNSGDVENGVVLGNIVFCLLFFLFMPVPIPISLFSIQEN